MIDKKIDKVKHESKPRDDGVELENQFILRIPEEPANVLHDALQTGNLKDRMTIKIDTDLRYGEVRLDQWLLHAKVVDLPTIVECLKTIDNKSFYKSADICQIMICKEEIDALDSEKESPNKGKKKDPNKVDKKYLWPHGITPPCKNVRKRRFRKTLKKKNVEAPEIEKEVKRLLRIDNDAVKVDYEIINEDVDIDKRSLETSAKDYNEGEDDYNDETINEGEKIRDDSSSQKDINIESEGDDDDGPSGLTTLGRVGEHDIFGEEVSSSENEDDDDRNRSSRLRDLEEGSRLSGDDTHTSEFSIGASGGGIGGTLVNDSITQANNSKNGRNEFNKLMFRSPKHDGDDMESNLAVSSGFYDDSKHINSDDDFSNDTPQMSADQINIKIVELRRQYDDLKTQQTQKAQEISSIQNPTLKQRMQETLDNLLSQIIEREMEIKDYENMLQ